MLNKETFLNSALIQIFLQAKLLSYSSVSFPHIGSFDSGSSGRICVFVFFFFLSFFFVVVRRSIWQYSQNNQNPTKRTPPQIQKLVSLDSGQLFQGNFGVEKVFFLL